LSTATIVSYDGTPNDDDALALGRLLGRAGASLSRAYVRHSREFDPGREAVAQHDAEQRLERGAQLLGQPEIEKHIVVSASTGAGLAELARGIGAALIVFGSDYRTPPGRVEPGATAQFLLQSGPVAIAIAPAGLRARTDERPGTIGVIDEGDPAAAETAAALASALGTTVSDSPVGEGVGLIVAASSPGGGAGQVLLSGSTRGRLENARAAVLVLPRGSKLGFDGA
jgi:nucleotide-binding universal stress UspA family protein